MNTKFIFYLLIFLALFTPLPLFAQEALDAPVPPPTEEVEITDEPSPESIPEEEVPAPDNVEEVIETQETEETPMEPKKAGIIVREGDNTIAEGEVELGDANVSIRDKDGEAHEVSGASVLGALSGFDASSSAFRISELVYYSSFNSLYLRCIDIGEEKCDYWMYEVNGEAPGVGMDANILEGGEEVVIYFDDSFFGGNDEEEGTEGSEENDQDSSPSASGGSSKRNKVKNEPVENTETDTRADEITPEPLIALYEFNPEEPPLPPAPELAIEEEREEELQNVERSGVQLEALAIGASPEEGKGGWVVIFLVIFTGATAIFMRKV